MKTFKIKVEKLVSLFFKNILKTKKYDQNDRKKLVYQN